MAVVCPLSLAAQDKISAMLHSQGGGVWVNGSEAAASTVVFAGDVVETKPGVVANLDVEGSSALIQPESIVKFQGTYLNLDHGGVSVGTSTSMSVHVNCIKVEPVSNERTQYEVADMNGTVQVAARKSDVNITHGGPIHKTSPENSDSQSATVHEGQQASRDESTICGAPPRVGGAGPGLNAKWLEIGAGAGVGALVICLLLCKSSTPISPSQP